MKVKINKRYPSLFPIFLGVLMKGSDKANPDIIVIPEEIKKAKESVPPVINETRRGIIIIIPSRVTRNPNIFSMNL